MESTFGRGVDVVLSASTDPDLSTFGSCLASNGKLILADSQKKPDFRLLGTAVFARGASVSSFSITNMIETGLKEVARRVHI